METQIVFDGTDIDEVRLFKGNARQDADDLLYEQIRSFVCRADSRDLTVKDMHENQIPEQYMLELESRKLRRQALTLQELRADIAGIARADRLLAPSENARSFPYHAVY